MKIEFRHAWNKRHGLRARDKLIAYLPRYAPWAARLAPLTNWAQALPLREDLLGLSMRRPLPRWRRDSFREVRANGGGKKVVLFVDTFTRWFEPENARAAVRVLQRAGCDVAAPNVCCGRTFLAEGLVDEARAEAKKLIAAVGDAIVVGLEPSCLFTLKDEYEAMGLGAVENATMFEDFIATCELPLKALPERTALLHGHCHQKSFAAMGNVVAALKRIPELEVRTVESSCCGMAGAFGYEADHYDVSVQMAEAALLPAVRAASQDTILVADGTSCRAQIRDGTGREAAHVARVLDRALE
jgi:Fe-S oxidoreductase